MDLLVFVLACDETSSFGMAAHGLFILDVHVETVSSTGGFIFIHLLIGPKETQRRNFYVKKNALSR